ncbi:MAG: D-aminoacyl-tRNA deacylase [Acidimicrobiia bacterium]
MRAVIQRVSRAEVTVDSELVGQIGRGLLVLVGVGPDDGEAEVEVLADKLVGLRIFSDDDGRMNRSVRDVGGGVLVVSQFTLYGDARKGRRPSFVSAAPPEVAEPLVADLVARLVAAGVQVGTGRFGAMMEVDLVNSGPVTLILEVAGGRVLGS